MRRLQASTDVAAIGIWDRSGQAPTLEQLARAGNACVVRMGGDTSGAVDVYIDEEIPAERLSDSTAMEGVRTLRVQSGEVCIDGAEFYSKSGGLAQAVQLSNGLYEARFYLGKSEDELPEPDIEKDLRRRLGAEDVAWYDRTNRNGVLYGLATLLVLPPLLFFVRWYVAVPATIVLFVGYFHVLQRVLRRNQRYERLRQTIDETRLRNGRPILTIQLTLAERV